MTATVQLSSSVTLVEIQCDLLVQVLTYGQHRRLVEYTVMGCTQVVHLVVYSWCTPWYTGFTTTTTTSPVRASESSESGFKINKGNFESGRLSLDYHIYIQFSLSLIPPLSSLSLGLDPRANRFSG